MCPGPALTFQVSSRCPELCCLSTFCFQFKTNKQTKKRNTFTIESFKDAIAAIVT